MALKYDPMSEIELSYLEISESSLSSYTSKMPSNFYEAITEFSKYCERQLPKIYQISFIPTCFCVSKKRENIILGGQQGNIADLHMPGGSKLRDTEICHSIPISNVLLVLDDTQIVLLNQSNVLYFLEYPSFEILHKFTLKVFPTWIKEVPSEKNLYFSGDPDGINIIKIGNEKDFYVKKTPARVMKIEKNCGCFDVSNDSSLLAVGMDNGMICIFYVDNERKVKETDVNSSKPVVVCFSHFAREVATAFEDYQIKVWALGAFVELKYELNKHTSSITGLNFVRENKYLVSSSLDAFIYIWDMSTDSNPYAMNLDDTPIVSLKGSKGGKSVYYIQESNQITAWDVPQLPKNANYKLHSKKINKIFFIKKNFEIVSISDDNTAIIWDCRRNSVIDMIRLEGKLTNAILSKSNENLFVLSTNPCIYKLNLIANTTEYIELANEGIAFRLSETEKYLAISDSRDRVTVYEFPSIKRLSQIKGHLNSIIECYFILDDKYLITASIDKTLGKWDIETGVRVGSCVRHESEITSMVISHEGWIISGSEDGTIIVWDFDCALIYVICSTQASSINSLYLSIDHSYLITLQDNQMSYWQLDSLSLLYQVDLESKSNFLAVSYDEKFIGIAQDHTIYIEENAIKSTTIRVIGKSLGSPYKYMKFIEDCLKDSLKAQYDMIFNHWIILPYMIGPCHILAYTNRFLDLNKALYYEPNKASFFCSIRNETPLYICIECEYKNCIDICLKYMKYQNSSKNGKVRNVRAYVQLEKCLTQLNMIEYPYITKLYDSLFIELDDTQLPRFCLHETDLPSLCLSEYFTIHPEKIVEKEFFSNTGRPIVFSQSALPLDVDLGTRSSIEFLNSLLKCSEDKIFRSKIINEYLQCKWTRVKPVVYVLGFIYVFYLILLGTYIICFIESKIFLSAMICVHIVLTLYEVLQLATDFTEYWKSTWNILDQLRSISFSYYAIMAWQEDYNTDILLAVLIFSWARGIACFRMFDETRYMVRLIIQVIIDISTFFFILFYATLAFTFVFYLRAPEDEPFPMYLTKAYRLDLGDFETGMTEKFDWALFFLSTMINPLIMLNLLIAIMSDTAAAVDDIDDICGLKELAEMIIDIEKVMIWKKDLTHKHYLHKCDFVQPDDSEIDETMEKVKIIKKQVVRMKNTVKSIEESALRICNNHINPTLEQINKSHIEFKNQMNDGFQSNKKLITYIEKELGTLE